MTRSILLCLLLAFSCHLDAATLNGLIKWNELGGPPVGGAMVSAFGANQTESLPDSGSFRLTFPDKFPGEVVVLTVSKPGCEVVNFIQLEAVFLPRESDSRPLIVLLCHVGNREEMALRFYRFKGVEAVLQNYRIRLREIEEKTQGDSANLAKLRKERDEAKAAAEKMAEELARVKPGQGSETYQNAMRAYLNGNLDKALV